MSDLNQRCLDAFPNWLRSLPADVRLVGNVIKNNEAPKEARAKLADALNYLFKSVDLIADGIEDLGYTDDAFVLRVAVAGLDAGVLAGLEQSADLASLGKEAELIREFLEDDYQRFEAYVAGLGALSVRGRTGTQIAEDEQAQAEFSADLSSWAASYDAPSFENDVKTLVKLRSFLKTKLA